MGINTLFCVNETSNAPQISSNSRKIDSRYVIEGHEAAVYENDKIIGRFLLKEVNETQDECSYNQIDDNMKVSEDFFALNLTLNGGRDDTKKIDKEEAEREQKCTHKPLELLEIAKRDSRVMDLIAQKSYSVGSYSSRPFNQKVGLGPIEINRVYN